MDRLHPSGLKCTACTDIQLHYVLSITELFYSPVYVLCNNPVTPKCNLARCTAVPLGKLCVFKHKYYTGEIDNKQPIYFSTDMLPNTAEDWRGAKICDPNPAQAFSYQILAPRHPRHPWRVIGRLLWSGLWLVGSRLQWNSQVCYSITIPAYYSIANPAGPPSHVTSHLPYALLVSWASWSTKSTIYKRRWSCSIVYK